MGKALSGELPCSGTGLVNVGYDGSMPEVWQLFPFSAFLRAFIAFIQVPKHVSLSCLQKDGSHALARESVCSRTSGPRILMARLPWLLRTRY